MLTNPQEVPEVWFCEACRPLNNIVSPKSDVKDHSSKAPTSNSSGIVSQENKDSNTSFSSKMVQSDTVLSVGPSKFTGEKDIQSSEKHKTLGPNISCGSRTMRYTSETVGFRPSKPAASLLPRNKFFKKVETGKVKFLPAEDILALTSGAKIKTSISQGGSGLKAGSFNTVPVNATRKSFHQKGPANRFQSRTKALTLGSKTCPRLVVKDSKILHRTSTSESLTNRLTEEDQSRNKMLSQRKTKRNDAEVCRALSNCVGPSECGVTTEKSDEPELLGLDKSAGNEASVAPNKYACKEQPVDAFGPPKEV